MTSVTSTSPGSRRQKCRPDRKLFVIPAKRIDHTVDQFLEEQRALLPQNPVGDVPVTDVPPTDVPTNTPRRKRHVSFKEPLVTVTTFEEWEERTITLTSQCKQRHDSGDSGIGSVTTDAGCSGPGSSFSSDVAQYPDRLQRLLTKAYTDMSALTGQQKRKMLTMMLVQVWKGEGVEEKAAYTCSCLIQREVDLGQGDSFCRVVESSCAGLIQDSATLKGQFHQWEKFITFLYHLSCHIKSADLHDRLHGLVTGALNVTLALLQL